MFKELFYFAVVHLKVKEDELLLGIQVSLFCFHYIKGEREMFSPINFNTNIISFQEGNTNSLLFYRILGLLTIWELIFLVRKVVIFPCSLKEVFQVFLCFFFLPAALMCSIAVPFFSSMLLKTETFFQISGGTSCMIFNLLALKAGL